MTWCNPTSDAARASHAEQDGTLTEEDQSCSGMRQVTAVVKSLMYRTESVFATFDRQTAESQHTRWPYSEIGREAEQCREQVVLVVLL